MSSPCLTDEQLEQLASGTLPAPQAQPLHEHASGCRSCRELLEECRANLRFVGTARESLIHAVDSLGAEVTKQDHPPPPPIASARVPGYTIVRELHRGAQGVIFEATQESTRKRVAIKFLREGPYASASARRRFEREIDLVADLHHPHIIGVFDAGLSAEGHPYYVMDYVEGVPLNRFVHDRELDLHQALRLFITVCNAVNHAHQRGVMHRDLKPSNILVDEDGVPHVLDFGLAKSIVSADGVLATQETFLSMPGQVIGTLPYMSPEQVRGHPGQIDIRTDVYALGVILYHVLTGRYPYAIDGPLMEVFRHITETPPFPPRKAWQKEAGVKRRARRRGIRGRECPIDNETATILLKALAKQPDRRYQNVATLADDLSRYLSGRPIMAKQDNALYVLGKTLSRHKAAVAAVVMVVALIAGFAGTMWSLYENQKYERQRADAALLHAVDANVRLFAAKKKLGMLAAEHGDLDEAAAQFQAALALIEHLAAGDWNDLGYQESRADVLLRLGDLEMQRAAPERARDFYRTCYELLKQMSQAEPANSAYRERLAVGCDRLAYVARESGNETEAEKWGRLAASIRNENASGRNER